LPEIELNIFPGKLNVNSHSILEFNKMPLMAVRKCGKGRVLQINSDSLWDLNFALDKKGLYEDIVQSSLMWLQKHPALNLNAYTIRNENHVGDRSQLDFNSALEKTKKCVISKDGIEVGRIELQAGFKKFNLDLPSLPGVYKIKIDDEQESLIALRYIENEYKQEKAQRESIVDLLRKGFSELRLGEDHPPLVHADKVSSTLKTDEPFHVSWFYLVVICGLIFSHWVIISRSPIHYT
jgi:hypothetical protein